MKIHYALAAALTLLFPGCNKESPETKADPAPAPKTATTGNKNSKEGAKEDSSFAPSATALKVGLQAAVDAGRESIVERGRITKAEAGVLTLASYVYMYMATNNNRPPAAAAGLRALVTKRLLDDETMLTDPWGEPYEYGIPALRSQKKFEIFSKGPNKIGGDDDDIGNWSMQEEEDPQ